MSTFVQIINDQTATIRACGRACPDMRPTTLPEAPPVEFISLSAMMREDPEIALDPSWLEEMDAGETFH